MAVSKMAIPLINMLILVITILNILSLRQLEEDAENRSQIKLLKNHVQEIERLNMILQFNKHEYSRHIETIQSMAYMDKNVELKEYIDGLVRQYRHCEEMINTGHSVINSLVNTKRNTAEANKIDFAVAVKCDLSHVNIPPGDLSTILGNLIDNALEAALEDKKPRVGIEFKHDKGFYIFYISNNGAVISDTKKIFEFGYSTKGSMARGYGLYLVKKLLDQYCGYIEIWNGKQTCITVKVPDGGKYNDQYSFKEHSREAGG